VDLGQQHGSSDFPLFPAPCTLMLPFRELQLGSSPNLSHKSALKEGHAPRLQGGLALPCALVGVHSSEPLLAGGKMIQICHGHSPQSWSAREGALMGPFCWKIPLHLGDIPTVWGYLCSGERAQSSANAAQNSTYAIHKSCSLCSGNTIHSPLLSSGLTSLPVPFTPVFAKYVPYVHILTVMQEVVMICAG